MRSPRGASGARAGGQQRLRPFVDSARRSKRPAVRAEELQSAVQKAWAPYRLSKSEDSISHPPGRRPLLSTCFMDIDGCAKCFLAREDNTVQYDLRGRTAKLRHGRRLWPHPVQANRGAGILPVVQRQLRAHRTPRKTRSFTRHLTLSPGNGLLSRHDELVMNVGRRLRRGPRRGPGGARGPDASRREL